MTGVQTCALPIYASSIADVIRNTYGWNVMKPDVIDNELWDGIYETYVTDRNNLGTKKYFSDVNPAALQEITAVMLETARKGMWKATPGQIKTLSELHTEMVDKYGAACSGFVCDNAKLRDFISQNVDKNTASQYNDKVAQVRNEKINDNSGTVMKRDQLNQTDTVTTHIDGLIVAVIVFIVLAIFVILLRRKRKKDSERQ